MLSDKARQLRLKLSGIFPLLNERQRRVLAAAEATAYGKGGVQAIALVTGMTRQTIYRGIKDFGDHSAPERVRNVGGGRKKLTEKNIGLVKTLQELIDPVTRGDPESPLRWTCKSVRKLSESSNNKGYSIGRQTVANILRELDYSLQANRKTSEGKKDHPDREEQFHYINKKAKSFFRRGFPVISVDTKKRNWLEIIKTMVTSGRRKENL